MTKRADESAVRIDRNPADDLMRAAMRHWRIVALVAAAITLLAWLAASQQPKRYRATALAAVNPLTDKLTPEGVIRGIDTLDRRVVVASVAALADAPLVANQSRANGYEINAVVLPNTSLFRVEVEGSNAQTAAAIANKIPALLDGQARTIYKMYGVMLVSPATASNTPVGPRAGRALAAGLVLGLLLGIAIAWILDRRQRV